VRDGREVKAGREVNVAAIILAAGASTRLGEPKQLVTLGDERLLERAVRVAREAGCAPIVVVLGASAASILAECRLGNANVVMNPDWGEGMAASIRCGVRSLDEDCGAAILMTCDQPAVTAGHLRQLIAGCIDKPVASSYAGRLGVPACFPAGYFGELLWLTGDEGARRLLESALTVDLAGGELDIDTPLTLAAARSVYS
jgi:molybdenum cofactor cytidylyltransferase